MIEEGVEIGQRVFGVLYNYQIFNADILAQDPNVKAVYKIQSGDATTDMHEHYFFKSKDEAIDFLIKELEDLRNAPNEHPEGEPGEV